jgi:hypothetical protein
MYSIFSCIHPIKKVTTSRENASNISRFLKKLVAFIKNERVPEKSVV